MPKKPTDAELLQEAMRIVGFMPEGDRLHSILTELHHRTAFPVGQQRFVSSWAAGRRARSEGIPLEECPFVERVQGKRTFTTAHRNAWIRGWKGLEKGFATVNLRRATMRQLLRRNRVGVAV